MCLYFYHECQIESIDSRSVIDQIDYSDESSQARSKAELRCNVIGPPRNWIYGAIALEQFLWILKEPVQQFIRMHWPTSIEQACDIPYKVIGKSWG